MEISSAPYLIDPTQFGLNDLEKNQARLADIKRKYKTHSLPTWHGAELVEYKVGPDEAYIISEVDQGDGPEIAYLVHLKMERLKALDSQSVTQVEVWRRKGAAIPAGLTKHVFFDILLKRFKFIVSDRSQTEKGRDFWLDRLGEADRAGHRVGVIIDDEVTWKDDVLFGPWIRTMEKSAWGTDNIHYDTRMVIER